MTRRIRPVFDDDFSAISATEECHPPAAIARLQRRCAPLVDRLGATKPIVLIGAACTLIALVGMISHLIG